mmetsp:Transcript_43144/g.63267  ORF Transcript_43144/g.63267 Transcript_43144/m.63267 type:complete len:303 (-) Transcript_43144:2788-3696(-)
MAEQRNLAVQIVDGGRQLLLRVAVTVRPCLVASRAVLLDQLLQVANVALLRPNVIASSCRHRFGVGLDLRDSRSQLLLVGLKLSRRGLDAGLVLLELVLQPCAVRPNLGQLVLELHKLRLLIGFVSTFCVRNRLFQLRNTLHQLVFVQSQRVRSVLLRVQFCLFAEQFLPLCLHCFTPSFQLLLSLHFLRRHQFAVLLVGLFELVLDEAQFVLTCRHCLLLHGDLVFDGGTLAFDLLALIVAGLRRLHLERLQFLRSALVLFFDCLTLFLEFKLMLLEQVLLLSDDLGSTVFLGRNVLLLFM